MNKDIRKRIEEKLIYVFHFRFDLKGFDNLINLIYLRMIKKDESIYNLIKEVAKSEGICDRTIQRRIENLTKQNYFLSENSYPKSVKKFVIFFCRYYEDLENYNYMVEHGRFMNKKNIK